jgi:hypothetical protein
MSRTRSFLLGIRRILVGIALPMGLRPAPAMRGRGGSSGRFPHGGRHR